MEKKELIFYSVILILLVVNIVIFTYPKTTGKAYTFPAGQPHTIYNLLQGISTDSSGYRFVVPDDASTYLIGATANLSAKLNFIGNATITESQYFSQYQNENYLIIITKNSSNYGINNNVIKINETLNKIKIFITNSDENTLIERINFIKGYEYLATPLNYSCINTTYHPVIPCVQPANTICNDSDSGLNYYVNGYITTGSNSTTPDTCVYNANGSLLGLREYYCNGTSPASTIYNCPNGCSNGACINATIACSNNTKCGTPTSNNYCNANGSACISTITPTCVNPGTVQSYCSNSTGGTCVACQYGCQNGACLQPAPTPTIAPTISQIKSTQNSLGYRNVIGSTATQDNIAAIDLAGFLKISQTLDDLQSTAMDYELVIGGPCVNRKAATLLNLSYPSCGNQSTIPQNKGIIKTFTKNNKTQILVAGWNAIDTRIAAQVIVRYQEFISQMNQTQIIVFGNSLDDVYVE